ncbi:MAG: glycyl-radical enzyme activating protein [Spirochaetaceae bacterium]|nr:glycyl-radical enzyme activating protein [Spirochaetaceae bacterium]
MRGVIFNIQKYSIHDGPGIRTTVFLKGCPLSCLWCSNPESQGMKVQVLWNESECVRCRSCLDRCPEKAVTVETDAIRINHLRCTGCGACCASCPGKALSLTGEALSVADAATACLEDRVFYEESGGGVTLSGGEVLAQSDFAEALLTCLGREGIHRAVETSGFAPPAVFTRLAARCDFILFDLKHHNREQHRQLTGVYNDLIIANLKAALDEGRPVLPRLPIVPGCNDSLADAAAYTDLLTALGAREVEILPFHQFGKHKYRLLGRDYALRNARSLQGEDLIPFAEVLKRGNIQVRGY